MSSIVIAGDTSGTCTLQANAIAGTTTLTLPTSSGALVVGASAGISIPDPGTSANLLTSNGTAWVSQAPATISTFPAANLTGTTLSSNVTSSSLTTVGTVTGGTWSSGFGAVSGANLTSLTAANLSGSRTIPKGTMPTGAILQVVQATTTTTLINNTGTQGTTNWVATSLTASITPTSSSSKILILTLNNVGGSNAYNQQLKIVRNGTTDINVGTVGVSNGGAAISTSTRQPDPDGINGVPMNYLDSPATTSSTTYTVYLGNTGGTQYQARFNLSVNNSTYTGNPLSTMILMEVAA